MITNSGAKPNKKEGMRPKCASPLTYRRAFARQRSGVRIPYPPPFDARGKLSGESFPRLPVPSGVEELMAGHLRLESIFSRVEWCPERATPNE